jgi:arabinofuranan 3-O-arabinosyltransferase
VPEYGHQNLGATLSEDEPIDENFALIEPFPERGSNAQTVAALQGARYLRAPSAGGLLEFPEYAAIHAFDGDPSTVWAADRYYRPRERWIEIGFERPRDVHHVDLLPVGDRRGIEKEVDINGVSAKLKPGWNRIPVELQDVATLRVTITKVNQPEDTELRGSGGFREIRIPGVRVREPLRPPVLVGRALAGRDLGRTGLTYLFERTTADRPFELDRQTGSPLLELARNRTDSERQIDRVVFSPAARSYAAEAWVHSALDARDSALDRLVGMPGPGTYNSSGRFHDQPRLRASSAFDGRSDTAWIGVWARPAAPDPWISWRSPRTLRVSRLRLTPASGPVRRPSLVQLSWAGGATGPLRVGVDGWIPLRRAVRARELRLTVLATRFPAGATARQRATRAVGIGSLEVPGLRPVTPQNRGPLRAPCGSVRIVVQGRTFPLRPSGTVRQLNAGSPLRARSCGDELSMGAGIQRIRSLSGPFSVDLLRLRSPAPLGLPAARGGGRVVDAGTLGHSSLEGARVVLRGSSWLVLGQAFSAGWEASCDGRELGKPRPINGYANGWPAPADCSNVAFSYGPQRAVNIGYLISAVVCLMLLAFLVAGRYARPWPRATSVRPALLPADRPGRLPLPRAAAGALVATMPLSFLFAARSSVVIFPLLTLILWRGAGSRLLTGIAAGLLAVVVPTMFAIISPKDRGGYNFEYSIELIWAHWVTVGALVLLIVACWRALMASRRAAVSPDPDAPPVSPVPSARATAPQAGVARERSAAG